MGFAYFVVIFLAKDYHDPFKLICFDAPILKLYSDFVDLLL